MSGKPDNSPSSGMQPFSQSEDAAPSGESQSFRLDALGGLETSGSSGKKKHLPIQAIFLCTLVIAGAGVVVAMRAMGLGAKFAFAAPPKLDFQNNSATDEHIKLLEELQSSHVEAQVPPELVQKNPFKMSQEAPVETAAAVPVDDGSAWMRKQAEERRIKIANTISRIQIHTILGGSNPVARVNDETIRVGDPFEEIFTVKAIEARHIIFECDGKEYMVSMDEQLGGSNKKTTR